MKAALSAQIYKKDRNHARLDERRGALHGLPVKTT
jgi:hypothetical protein